MFFRGEEVSDYSVVDIDDHRLVLHGGGNFFNAPSAVVDDETRATADELARRFDMQITSMCGAWWGYSEYTPDPGSVSIFDWTSAATVVHEDCKAHPELAAACPDCRPRR